MTETSKITRGVVKTLVTVSAAWGMVRLDTPEPGTRLTIHESRQLRRALKRAEVDASGQEAYDINKEFYIELPPMRGGLHRF